MIEFLKRLSIFMTAIILLLIILITVYLIFDPFKVVHKYEAYYNSGEPSYITLNRDFVSVETFINNYPEYNYNSFIFGNSRSRFYEMETWSKLIQTDKCFHFDASAESLYGINKKIEFLEKLQVKISNALIIFDYETLKKITNSKGHLFIKHPVLSGQSRFSFQVDFFKTFCSFSFLPAYLDFKISGRIKNYMINGHLLDDVPLEYNLKFNEMSYNQMEGSIHSDPSSYYNSKKMKRFVERDTTEKYSMPAINKEQKILLQKIREVFRRDQTRFKIIISPLYDQIRLSSEDITELKSIFGNENVYDFSGINSFTSDYHNYYEESHYRPQVANEIMKLIYKN